MELWNCRTRSSGSDSLVCVWPDLKIAAEVQQHVESADSVTHTHSFTQSHIIILVLLQLFCKSASDLQTSTFPTSTWRKAGNKNPRPLPSVHSELSYWSSFGKTVDWERLGSAQFENLQKQVLSLIWPDLWPPPSCLLTAFWLCFMLRWWRCIMMVGREVAAVVCWQ